MSLSIATENYKYHVVVHGKLLEKNYSMQACYWDGLCKTHLYPCYVREILAELVLLPLHHQWICTVLRNYMYHSLWHEPRWTTMLLSSLLSIQYLSLFSYLNWKRNVTMVINIYARATKFNTYIFLSIYNAILRMA